MNRRSFLQALGVAPLLLPTSLDLATRIAEWVGEVTGQPALSDELSRLLSSAGLIRRPSDPVPYGLQLQWTFRD